MNHGVLLYVLVSLRRNERPPTSAANHFCHCSFIVLCERLQYILFSNICFSVFIPNESRCRAWLEKLSMSGLIVRRLRAWSSRRSLIKANHNPSYRYDKNTKSTQTVRTFSNRCIDCNSCIFSRNAINNNQRTPSLCGQTKQPSMPGTRFLWLCSGRITVRRLH